MYSNSFRAAALIAMGLVAAGCTSMGNKTVIPAGVTVPGEGERVTLHEVVVVMDASGSMYPGTSFAYGKALTESMVKAFPDGNYHAGMLSFGGEWTFEWLEYRPAPLDRPNLEGAAANLRFLAGSTPLNEAVAYVGARYLSRDTNRALIIVSDGKTPRQPLLDTAMNLAQGGNLCIHTVQVGNDRDGGRLLSDLANVTSCGSYRHGDMISTEAGMDAFIREVFFQDLAMIEMVRPDGTRELLGTILFDTDKSVVKPHYNGLLNRVADELRDGEGLFVCVAGHTDSTGSNAYNMGLAQRRADAVYRALLDRGADRDRVFTKAYGEESPTATNDTAEGRQQNRRVELVVID